LWKEMRHEGTENTEVSLRAFVVILITENDNSTRTVVRNERKLHNPKVFS